MRRTEDHAAGFFGRPPFAPLARAASAFAADRTLPPLRPKSTAAGFLRGIVDALYAVERRQPASVGQQAGRKRVPVGAATGDVLFAAVLELEGVTAGNSPEALHGMCHGFAAVHDVAAESVVHTGILPNRLGFVKWG